MRCPTRRRSSTCSWPFAARRPCSPPFRWRVFDALLDGPRAAADLAAELSADPEAVGRLLDACVGLKLLEKRDGRYANTPVAATYLSSTSPRRLTGYIQYSNDVLWKLWGHLDDAVLEGRHRWHQAFGWDGPIFSSFFRTDEALREFLMGMHGLGLISSPQVVAAFDLGRFHHLVDLGGATGHLAIAACERYPDLRATVFDLPEAQPLAREIVSRSSVADRVLIEPGDFFSDPLPCGRPLRSGPDPSRLDRRQDPPASRTHPRRVTGRRSRPDCREARARRPIRPRRGADAGPEHAHLHRGAGTVARGVRGLAP